MEEKMSIDNTTTWGFGSVDYCYLGLNNSLTDPIPNQVVDTTPMVPLTDSTPMNSVVHSVPTIFNPLMQQQDMGHTVNLITDLWTTMVNWFQGAQQPETKAPI